MSKKFLYPPLIAAQDFHNLHKTSLKTINNKQYLYTNGKYVQIEISDLRNLLVNFLMEKNSLLVQDDLTESYIRSILICFEAICFKDSIHANLSELLTEDLSETVYVPVKNGILNLYKKNGEYKKVITPYNPNFFTTNFIDTNFIKNSHAKRFRKLLLEIIPDKEQRSFLQEFIGYSLTRNTTHNLLVIIFGPGANGKSVFLTALKATFGKGCYESLSISDLQGRDNYKMARIEDIFINLCDEIPEDRKISTDKIKNITSGGEIIVRKIYKAPSKLKVTTKLLFCSNNLPRFTDKSDAIFRRMYILNFPNQFLDVKKQDKRLLNEAYWKSEGETEGILLWAIEGLLRLLKRGHFIEPEYSRLTKEQFRLEENPEREFILDTVEYTGNKYNQVSTLDIYKRYEAYCNDYGIIKKPHSTFSTELRRVYPKVGKTNPRMDKKVGKKVRYFTGIGYKSQVIKLKADFAKKDCSIGSMGVNNEQ